MGKTIAEQECAHVVKHGIRLLLLGIYHQSLLFIFQCMACKLSKCYVLLEPMVPMRLNFSGVRASIVQKKCPQLLPKCVAQNIHSM